MISLIVTDIDGCLIPGGTSAFNLKFFEQLQAWNQAALDDSIHPPITLCTGRPAPFCEALGRAMDLHLPLLCESGGVLYDYHSGEVSPHPALNDGAGDQLAELRQAVEDQFLKDGRTIYLEPGKTTEITLIPWPVDYVDEVWEEALVFVTPYSKNFILSRTRRVINFTHRQMHKGKGLKRLAQKLGVALESIAGFGDGTPDIAFLESVGISGCPSNADPNVKKIVDFIASVKHHDGFEEFLEHVLEHNRARRVG